MQQVADWLEKIGLGQYAQRFAENDIDVERIWIEGTDTNYKADEVIRDVLNIAESWLAKVPKEASSG
jgi:SAM domain (Sterile alpha motif)